MNLDDKLRDILLGASYAVPLIDEESGAGSAVMPMYLRALKKAFTDEGYVHIPQVETVTRYERGAKPELFMVNGKEVMTGQQWYDRFEREYHLSADWIAGDHEMGDDAENDVLNAAKRAAGL